MYQQPQYLPVRKRCLTSHALPPLLLLSILLQMGLIFQTADLSLWVHQSPTAGASIWRDLVPL
jgi:hypothetical protein